MRRIACPYPVLILGTGGRSQFPGTDQPAYYWDPAIAPASIAFYTADLVPEWNGNLFVAALGGHHLARLVMEDGKVRLLRGNDQRVRDVKQAPDGALGGHRRRRWSPHPALATLLTVEMLRMVAEDRVRVRPPSGIELSLVLVFVIAEAGPSGHGRFWSMLLPAECRLTSSHL